MRPEIAALWSFCADVPSVTAGTISHGQIGVYILLRRDEVRYVGQSTDVPRRVAQHRSNDQRYRRERQRQHLIGFDRAIWIRLPESSLDAIEGALIRHFRPAGNAGHPRGGDLDAGILAAFGIESSLVDKDLGK